MTKYEFLVAYVLNRAQIVDGVLEGDGAAKEAVKAWKVIEDEIHSVYKKTTCNE